MSRLAAFLDGVGFRTSTPAFEPGEEVVAFVTGVADGRAVVRVGDTRLFVADAPEGAVDTQVRLRVESFDADDHTGTASYVDTVGRSAY